MKIENWDVWLVAFANAAWGQRFVWGRTDCATLTRRGLATILGNDPWKGHVRSCRSKRAALEIMKSLEEPENVLSATGAVEVGHHFGTSGDVALGPVLDDHGLVALSIMLPGRKVLVSTKEFGVLVLDKLNLPEGTRFFRYV